MSVYKEKEKVDRMRRIILIPASIYVAMAVAAAQGSCPYSLGKALGTAYRNRSSLKARCSAIRQFSAEQYAELSGYLPQINFLTAPWLESKEKLFGKNITVLSASQLIYSFAGPLQQYQIAKKNTCIAQMAQEAEKDAIRFQTELSFLQWYDVLRRQRSVELLDRAAQAVLDRARTAYDTELISTTSWLDSVAQYAQADALVKSYPNEQFKIKYAVERAIEQAIPSCIDMFATKQFIERAIIQSSQTNTDYYIRTALACRKELAIKDLEIEREEMLESYYKKSYLPSAYFFSWIVNNGPIPIITQDLSRVIPGFTQFKTFWAFGIGFGWRFDGLGNAARACAQNASATVKILEKKDLQQQITLEVKEAHEELEQLHYELKAQQEQYSAAQKTFQLRNAEYKVGQISDVEFERAQFIWEDEQYKLENVKIKIAQKYHELLYRSGYPNQCSECRI